MNDQTSDESPEVGTTSWCQHPPTVEGNYFWKHSVEDEEWHLVQVFGIQVTPETFRLYFVSTSGANSDGLLSKHYDGWWQKISDPNEEYSNE